jgi:hypothetical protein
MFPAEGSWPRRFTKVDVILDTVASSVLSPFIADLDPDPGRARYVTLLTATIVRSAPERARAHPILLSVAVVRGLVSSPHVSRPDPLWPSSTFSDRNCG